MKIMTAVDYMEKELKHACKFLDYALEAKNESPELFEIYFKIAENEAANAESIHTVIIRMIDKATLNSDTPNVMKEIWTWRHKAYVEEYSHFKAKMESLKKLI